MKNIPVKMLNTLIGLASLTAAFSARADVLWTASGETNAAACARVVREQGGLKIVSGGGAAVMDQRQTKDVLPPRSLVQVLGRTPDHQYEIIRLLTAGEGASPRTSGEVYTRPQSLEVLDDEVLEVRNPLVRGRLSALGVDAAVTYWQPVAEGNRLTALRCAGGDADLFQVFIAGKKEPVARIAIDAKAVSLFAGSRVLTPEEAEKAVLAEIEEETQQADESETTGSAGGGFRHRSDFGSDADRVKTSGSAGVTASTTATTKKEKTAFAAEETRVSAPATTTTASTAAPAATTTATPAAVPVIQGSLEYVICTKDAGVNVRDEKLVTQIFVAQRFEDAKPMQTFGSEKQTRVISGKTYTFIKVQFPRRAEGKNVGWVAQDFVKAKSECSGYKPVAAAPAATTAAVSGSLLQNGLFPTISRPADSYFNGARMFGARRDKGRRIHAAADLYRKHGEAALAIGDGKVIQGPYKFYQGTYAVEVKFDGGYVVRYGEVTGKVAPKIGGNASVKRGQTIGYIGTVNSGCCAPMLHFEMYTGKKKGPLSTGGRGYQRRSDLMNPSQYLRIWEKNKFGAAY